MRRLRGNGIGVWLGVLAVALYAWLPVHFAADVVQAVSHARAALDGGTTDSSSHRHAHHPAGDSEHHNGTCPICAAASAAPAAAMLPAMAALPMPPAIPAQAGIAEADTPSLPAPLTPYAPRGPPRAA